MLIIAVFDRLWQDAQNRVYIINELDRITGHVSSLDLYTFVAILIFLYIPFPLFCARCLFEWMVAVARGEVPFQLMIH